MTGEYELFDSFEEAVFFVHNEHTDCQCQVCSKVRIAHELSTLQDGTKAKE